MTCEKAEQWMMRYMDGTLTEAQAEALADHVETCKQCKEAFLAYDQMMESFAALPQVVAPEGLEEAVMLQIQAIPAPQRAVRYSKKDRLKFWFGGAFALLFGLGAWLVSNQEQVLTYLANNEATGQYAKALLPVAQMMHSQRNELLVVIEQVLMRADAILTALAGPLLLAILGLCVVQVMRLRRK